MNVPPIAPGCGSSMISARPITPDSGRPPAIDFATIMRSGSTSKCSIANIRPVRPNPVCTSSATRTIPCSSQIPRRPFDERRGRGEEAALALLRLEHDRGDVLRRDVRREHALERRERGRGVRAAIGVRVRRAVDLGRERPEPLLVRVRLRRHRQRHPRAAVERALERDDGLPLRVQARELDGVLDRLGAGVEERGARLAADRRERAEPLGELDVALVRDDREVGVQEALGLLGDRLDDARVVVADVRHADAADEVDERVAVDVGDRRPARPIGDDRLVDDQRTRDRVPLALEDLAAARAGNLRPDLDHAGGRHARQPIRPTCR